MTTTRKNNGSGRLRESIARELGIKTWEVGA